MTKKNAQSPIIDALAAEGYTVTIRYAKDGRSGRLCTGTISPCLCMLRRSAGSAEGRGETDEAALAAMLGDLARVVKLWVELGQVERKADAGSVSANNALHDVPPSDRTSGPSRKVPIVVKKSTPKYTVERADTDYQCWHVNDASGERVVYSFVEASAVLAAEKLETGKPLQTPREAMERSLKMYGAIYPTRCAYYDQVYVMIGNGLEWINGGLSDEDVTCMTEEGMQSVMEEQRRSDESMRSRFKGLDDVRAKEPDNFALYKSGKWPIANGKYRLYPGCQYSRFNGMIDVERIAPEWLTDARSAMRLLLKHGVNSKGNDTLATMRTWAEKLTEKFGGEWTLPPELSAKAVKEYSESMKIPDRALAAACLVTENAFNDWRHRTGSDLPSPSAKSKLMSFADAMVCDAVKERKLSIIGSHHGEAWFNGESETSLYRQTGRYR